jgi:hypothetical protein
MMEMPYDGESERLVGVMGLQQLEDLTLIRLANVRMALNRARPCGCH